MAAATLLCIGFSTPLPSHAYVAEIAQGAATLLSLVSRFLPSAANPADIAVFQNRQLLADLHARFDGFEQALARTEFEIKKLPAVWRTDLKNEFREQDHRGLRASFGEIDDYMIVASQGHNPLVSPDIKGKYDNLKKNARNLMEGRFDFWNLPILLVAFSYEYRIHHAFKIPDESALNDKMDVIAEEMKKLRHEQQQYIRTASEEGKLTAVTGPDGNLLVRSPLPPEHEDDVATALEDYNARRKQLESRFTVANRELQAYRDTVRYELKTMGNRYSTYFNKAPMNFYNLISEADTKSRQLSKDLGKFRRAVHDKIIIRYITEFRHHYDEDFLPKACLGADILDVAFTAPGREAMAQDFFNWEVADWEKIDNQLRGYHKRADDILQQFDRKKNWIKKEMRAYSSYFDTVAVKFDILDSIYGEIPPGINSNGKSFDFNQLSVRGSVTTEERRVFGGQVKTLKNNLDQLKKALKHIIDNEYRRLTDSVKGFHDSIPVGQPRLLATACCHWVKARGSYIESRDGALLVDWGSRALRTACSRYPY